MDEEPAGNQADSEGMTISSMVESFSQARMLSEQNALKEELSGTSVDISIKITSVERTFGIGISDRYRGGNTVVASLHDQGMPSGNEVENSITHDDSSTHEVSVFFNREISDSEVLSSHPMRIHDPRSGHH